MRGGASHVVSSHFSQGSVDRPPIYLFVVPFLLISDWMWKIWSLVVPMELEAREGFSETVGGT